MTENKAPKGAADNLFNDSDFDEGVRETLTFPSNTPTKFKIVEVKDGILDSNNYPYYVLCTEVLDGENEGKEHEIFVMTAYDKDGVKKANFTFKKVLGGLAKSFAKFEQSEGRGNDLPETFKTQIDRIIGRDVEIAFFEKEGKYQNLIYIKDLTAKAEAEAKEEKAGDF